ncbi:hypothetical protein [Nocardioides furvisabuli]|uniref:hypothetical protein n=1 Tax=Nocardioides furvisabuli TaxID=375542 RepID=UPI001E2C05EE|nr:hypothetical protein [Nocardioides furvisabuli]
MAKLVTWGQYRQSVGDRSSLFAALTALWPIRHALYVGSYVDLAPSTAIEIVTYVDNDVRATRFFGDPDLIRAELDGRTRDGAGVEVRFHPADYYRPLPVDDSSVDLLISLFTGPAWEHTRRYVRPGGLLLANASHGDASLAALDPSLQLVGVAHEDGERYRITTDELEEYLVPRRPSAADPDAIRRSGRGIAYTRSAFAYIFRTPS